jgi:hypothetical protein
VDGRGGGGVSGSSPSWPRTGEGKASRQRTKNSRRTTMKGTIHRRPDQLGVTPPLLGVRTQRIDAATLHDPLQHRIRFLEHLPVREPKHRATQRSEMDVAVLVVRRLARGVVDSTVELHNELQLVTVEVRDEDADRGLAPELQMPEATVAKQLPHPLLGWSLRLSQFARSAHGILTPRPLSRGERGRKTPGTERQTPASLDLPLSPWERGPGGEDSRVDPPSKRSSIPDPDAPYRSPPSPPCRRGSTRSSGG